jgi:hypothetical protein
MQNRNLLQAEEIRSYQTSEQSQDMFFSDQTPGVVIEANAASRIAFCLHSRSQLC